MRGVIRPSSEEARPSDVTTSAAGIDPHVTPALVRHRRVYEHPPPAFNTNREASVYRVLQDMKRPRQHGRPIDLEQREPVPARKGGACVDVPAVAELLHLLNNEMPVHQGAKPIDWSAAMPVHLFLGRINAKQRSVADVRRPRLKHRGRDRPVRHVGVHEAHRTVRGLARHRELYSGARGAPAPVLRARYAEQPVRWTHTCGESPQIRRSQSIRSLRFRLQDRSDQIPRVLRLGRWPR